MIGFPDLLGKLPAHHQMFAGQPGIVGHGENSTAKLDFARDDLFGLITGLAVDGDLNGIVQSDDPDAIALICFRVLAEIRRSPYFASMRAMRAGTPSLDANREHRGRYTLFGMINIKHRAV